MPIICCYTHRYTGQTLAPPATARYRLHVNTGLQLLIRVTWTFMVTCVILAHYAKCILELCHCEHLILLFVA